jgi:hypothetical protein
MKFIKAIVFILIQTACFGQSKATVSFSLYLADIATIAVAKSNTSTNFVGTAPTLAGGSLTFSSNNNLWINFTSQVPSGITRNITAQITSGSLPIGTTLKLTLISLHGTGSGTPGTTTAVPITISSSPTIIIRDIGNAITGTGVGNGYNLTFELAITDYSQLRSGNTSISIIFTIT